MLKKIVKFIIRIFTVCIDNELPSRADEMTYRLVIAFFPFLIFLMSLIGFFNFDSEYFLNKIYGVFPDIIQDMVNMFVREVVYTRSAGLLSVSLLIVLYNASAGFQSIIKGINRAYGLKDKRNFIVSRLISVFLAIAFAGAIILSIGVLVFGNVIFDFLKNYNIYVQDFFLYGFFRYFITMMILLSTIIMIYRFAIGRRSQIYKLIPGALTTLVVWIASSKIFNIYINNFAKFSKIYGSLAGIMILIYWINIISLTLLIGGVINALLDDDPATP